ncbi:hypothetical protein L21_1076 [Methanoculleus chikugoensis]|jgi:hypothetical protein|uniref:Uncharacterized protein n=1 Tax=Methanoculleus chikugoensis TaxID=118126 RepID=A0A1M4MJU7_9EURY|nr:hypothetical protein [Methanoculleus chikugoensis]MDD4566740.1 hypothetical protein [Methanoculleus chikugoensis]SCL75184.1 hypothetical protein L21_1076 [Methanoculleus chikugoensis]
MGQHDPLDGFVTYNEFRAAAGGTHLSVEIAGICRGGSLVTDDPLGIGGLLFDAERVAQLADREGFAYEDLLASVLDAALSGLAAFARGGMLHYPADHRLAFRELGLSIGLHGVGILTERLRENPALFRWADALMWYVPLVDEIERFWLDSKNREAGTWMQNREINVVMLATSLAPGEFLAV